MPLTYIDIEKQKTWRIGIFFLILIFMYFCVTFSLVYGILLFVFPFQFLKSGTLLIGNAVHMLLISGFSIILAAMHFWFSASGAVEAVIKNLGAIPPDADDGIHRRLADIMDEIHVVTGDKRKIDCMVIPSLSMNALAVADLKGNSVIAITEGLLSRLTRSQTEAVLAHEAYHILSGDCMEATVATSIFGLYAAMIEKLQDLGDDNRRGLHPAFFLFWLLLKLSHLLSMFISREREYRADAAAVRMTRNPLALAEALHIISRNWRGAGPIGMGLEALCILNPREDRLDESEGFWANLLSTHPPIKKRINILLRMVRSSITELEAAKDREMKKTALSPDPNEFFYVFDPDKKWKGPLPVAGLAALPWFSPMSWVSRGPGKAAQRASEDVLIGGMFTDRKSHSGIEVPSLKCPHCRQSLFEIPYEKTKVYQCRYCGGILVDNTKIPRIIARREKEFGERVKSLARAMINDNQRRLSIKKLTGADSKAKPHLSCPKCLNPMMRTFYSLAYLVEIDRCGLCNLTWFDTDELEMLQCLIENRITATIGNE
jgi:heat shock protein HtpX